MEELVVQLSYIYPNMFRECEGLLLLESIRASYSYKSCSYKKGGAEF